MARIKQNLVTEEEPPELSREPEGPTEEYHSESISPEDVLNILSKAIMLENVLNSHLAHHDLPQFPLILHLLAGSVSDDCPPKLTKEHYISEAVEETLEPPPPVLSAFHEIPTPAVPMDVMPEITSEPMCQPSDTFRKRRQEQPSIFTQSSGIAEPKKSKLGTTISSSINSGNKDESSLGAGQTIKIPRRLNRYCTERSKPPRPIRPANYYDVAAVLPEIKNKKDILAEVSRGECVYDATSINDADHLAWLDYGYTCEAKIGCDIHTAFQHLAKNDYSIKRAMETIDAADSIPMLYIHGRHSTGIWTVDEMKTFIRMMNNKNNYKKLYKISKQIPNKTVSNVVNTFYALKKLTCSTGRKFNLCPEKIRKHNQDYTTSSCSSKDCHNCVYKLWLKTDNSPTDCKLCSLCSLYFKMFSEHRPNAEVTPLIFDYSALEPHENCKLRSPE